MEKIIPEIKKLNLQIERVTKYEEGVIQVTFKV